MLKKKLFKILVPELLLVVKELVRKMGGGLAVITARKRGDRIVYDPLGIMNDSKKRSVSRDPD